ncbi:MAG: hypothetical protein D6689_11380 [Deltaproteobacteria bacterium]|nr:MAG: hypothetical protein D6689_11380 [Deltaproteobacteria bacterium]
MVASCSLFDSGRDGDDAAPDGGLGQSCRTAGDCAASFVCAGGTCQLEGTVGLGGSCWATRDCGAGLYCQPVADPTATAGVCAPAGTGDVGDPCATGAECARGLVCQLFGFGGTCQAAGSSDLGEACTGTLDCIAGLACAPDGTCKAPPIAYPPFTGVDCADDAPPFRAFFEVPRPSAPPADFFRLPFPNDIRVADDGTLDMSDFPRPGPSVLGVDVVSRYVDALVADFAGFSSVGVVTFRFSQRVDFDTATADAVQFVDVTPGAPEFGSALGRSWGYTTARTLYNCQHRFNVRNDPDNPLLPGHTYAVVLTTAIRAFESGDPAVADTDLAAVLASERPAGDDALAAAWDRYAPLRAYLSSQGIDPGTVAGAAVFTVADPTARMRALAAAEAAEPAPLVEDLTLCDGVAVSPCDDGGARACGAPNPNYYEIHGRIRIPIYQVGDAPYETEGGALNLVGGEAVKVRDEMVCFAMTVPKAEPAPPGGWPYVVYGHGTGGSMRSVIATGVAEALATAATPAVAIGFDGVVHGERKAGSTRDSDSLMFNVINPPAARDNHLQGGVDVLHVLRLHEAGPLSVPGVGDVALDGARRYYFGHSQGSNVGIPALAVSNAAPAAVLSGAGAFLTVSLTTKTSPVDAEAGLKFLIDPDFDGSHPVMTVFQTYFDPADTVNFAPLLIRRPPAGVASKHVLMTYGPGDTFSPPASLERMAGAAALDVVEPVIEDIDRPTVARPVGLNKTGGDGAARMGAVFQYQPDGYDGHFVAQRNPAAVADWLAFFTSLADTGAPAVP